VRVLGLLAGIAVLGGLAASHNYLRYVRIPLNDLVCFVWDTEADGVTALWRREDRLRLTRIAAFTGSGSGRIAVWIDMWVRKHRELETARLAWTPSGEQGTRADGGHA
jgi:hypothetical protein